MLNVVTDTLAALPQPTPRSYQDLLVAIVEGAEVDNSAIAAATAKITPEEFRRHVGIVRARRALAADLDKAAELRKADAEVVARRTAAEKNLEAIRLECAQKMQAATAAVQAIQNERAANSQQISTLTTLADKGLRETAKGWDFESQDLQAQINGIELNAKREDLSQAQLVSQRAAQAIIQNTPGQITYYKELLETVPEGGSRLEWSTEIAVLEAQVSQAEGVLKSLAERSANAAAIRKTAEPLRERLAAASTKYRDWRYVNLNPPKKSNGY